VVSFWIAISVYVLVAIMKKQLRTEHSLYTLLQMLSVTLFEKIEVSQALTNMNYTPTIDGSGNQLLLFNF
jgi:hypothetical protein